MVHAITINLKIGEQGGERGGGQLVPHGSSYIAATIVYNRGWGGGYISPCNSLLARAGSRCMHQMYDLRCETMYSTYKATDEFCARYQENGRT